MLLFQLEEHVETWRNQADEPRGELLPIAQVWELSKLWYGSRMSPKYRGRTPADVEAIFMQVGLTSPFWKFA